MPLPEGSRSAVAIPETVQFSFTRGTASQQTSIQAAEAGELARSLELLRSTNLHLSLFRILLSELPADEAVQVMDRAFGSRGMISRLNDGSFALLLIGTNSNARVVDTDTCEALNRALCGLNLRSPLEIAAIHRAAPEIGDPDDILLQLTALPTRCRRLGRAA
jgi:hypothetical protein